MKYLSIVALFASVGLAVPVAQDDPTTTTSVPTYSPTTTASACPPPWQPQPTDCETVIYTPLGRSVRTTPTPTTTTTAIPVVTATPCPPPWDPQPDGCGPDTPPCKSLMFTVLPLISSANHERQCWQATKQLRLK
jgi:hypothetical protein